MKKTRDWFVYIVETVNGSLYTGITKDLERRFSEHSDGKKGAKFFNSSKPKEIKFTKSKLNHSQALKLEYKIKQMTKSEKLKLIEKAKS